MVTRLVPESAPSLKKWREHVMPEGGAGSFAGDATLAKALAALGQDPAALACSSAICLRAAATSSSLVFA